MRYRIEYHNRHCEYAESQKELEKRLTSFMLLGNIADIRKVYANGSSFSVMDAYREKLMLRMAYPERYRL